MKQSVQERAIEQAAKTALIYQAASAISKAAKVNGIPIKDLLPMVIKLAIDIYMIDENKTRDYE
jgi:hypothetical protein